MLYLLVLMSQNCNKRPLNSMPRKWEKDKGSVFGTEMQITCPERQINF